MNNMNDDDMAVDPAETSQVEVRFEPANASAAQRAGIVVPAHPIAVPLKLTRYGLSEIVNHLAGLGMCYMFEKALVELNLSDRQFATALVDWVDWFDVLHSIFWAIVVGCHG
jgi:NLE (NUC135) domain